MKWDARSLCLDCGSYRLRVAKPEGDSSFTAAMGLGLDGFDLPGNHSQALNPKS